MSSSYDPQTDGQTKVINHFLEKYLRGFIGDQPWKWFDWIPWTEYNYKTSIHFSTKMTPFKAMYGIPPPSFLKCVLGTSKVQEINEFLCDRDSILYEFQRNLLLAPNLMK